MSIGDTPLASYSYDAAGRVSGINNVSFGYLANSNLLSTVTRPNNVNTTWSYEANRDLVSSIENKLNNTVISNYAYTNDALGRRTAMARSGSVFTTAGDTLSYSYNDRSEVTGANSNAANTTYNYAYSFDNIGNRLTANLAGTPWTYTANNLNQYSAFTINQVAETPSYDDDGNMLTRDGWTQTWNSENRLIKAEKGTAKLEFAYDYMGRRIFKKVYNGETLTSHIRFVYDGYKLIEELNAQNNNAVLRRYTWSPVGLDTPVSVYDAAANATYYYHTDANKNITELTDATGAVVAHYEYSPFGKVLVANGEYASINPFRFSSEYHDDESGLVYYNYRYYSPELGRWLSRDPIGEKGGWNLYIMLNNRIIDYWDFAGLCKIEIRYKHIGGTWFFKWYHAYVIVTDKDGSQTYYRSGPESRGYDLAGSSGGASNEIGGSASSNSGSMGSNSNSGSGSSNSSQSGSSQGSNSGSDSSNSNSAGNSSQGSGSSHASSSNSSASYPGAVRGPGFWGYIYPESGEYVKDTIDWENVTPPSVTILDNDEPCDCYKEKLQNALDNIRDKKIPYHPLSDNSNATAHQIIEDSGFPRPVPPKGVWAPGHDVNLNR